MTGGGAAEDVYPLTPAQSGMLFHSLSEPERDMYTGHFGVRLDGVADPGALALAWQRVVDRTPALRTSVVWQDVPEPVQVVHRDVEVPVTHLDWRKLPAAEREEALDRYWDERVGRSLDLTQVPLLRLTVVRLTDTSVEMFWATHHMMVDGWSFSHVLSDVFQEYAAGTAGSPPAPARQAPSLPRPSATQTPPSGWWPSDSAPSATSTASCARPVPAASRPSCVASSAPLGSRPSAFR